MGLGFCIPNKRSLCHFWKWCISRMELLDGMALFFVCRFHNAMATHFFLSILSIIQKRLRSFFSILQFFFRCRYPCGLWMGKLESRKKYSLPQNNPKRNERVSYEYECSVSYEYEHFPLAKKKNKRTIGHWTWQ